MESASASRLSLSPPLVLVSHRHPLTATSAARPPFPPPKPQPFSPSCFIPDRSSLRCPSL
eukprot:scaffold2564_cov25-Tisochrysis_lutea.AAC.1